MAEYQRRESFEERIQAVSKETVVFYNQIKDKLLSYDGVKSRVSLRCDSFRLGGKLIAKIALGGKSLKVFLAIDIDDDIFSQVKGHPRDMSSTTAYAEVPTMMPVKSALAAKKVINVIEQMMA